MKHWPYFSFKGHFWFSPLNKGKWAFGFNEGYYPDMVVKFHWYVVPTFFYLQILRWPWAKGLEGLGICWRFKV